MVNIENIKPNNPTMKIMRLIFTKIKISQVKGPLIHFNTSNSLVRYLGYEIEEREMAVLFNFM